MTPFTPPEFGKSDFNCPFCNAHAEQHWHKVSGCNSKGDWEKFGRIFLSRCNHCNKYMIWNDEKIVFPDVSGAPLPNVDLPENIKADYMEARSIFTKSPRGAAALLRLCVQKLCKHLGEDGENLNADIGALVKKGLPVTIQQSLDIVRVIGNNAVHPGTIDLKDSPVMASKLFEIVNLIVQIMITQPKEIKALYDALPDGAKNGIAVRDK